MAVFRYSAIDKNGVIYRNICTATSLEEAKRQLRQMGVLVKSIEPKDEASSRISPEQIGSFFHQLSTLMQAGFPLYEALVALQEQNEGEPMHDLLMTLSDQIHSGLSLADALGTYPSIFEASLLSMIRAGERSAKLGSVLERVAKVMKANERIKKQLVTSMIYPALLAVVSVAILLLMLLIVVPALEPLFEGSTPSSNLTLIVFGASSFLRHFGFWILLSFIGGFLIILPWLRSYIRSGKWQDLAIKMPLLGPLMMRSRLARFGFVMQALLESGVQLVEALDIASPLLKVGPLAKTMERASQKVMEGEHLSSALSDPAMPKLLPRLIKLGENSGNLSASFAHLQEMMDEELQKDLARLTAVAQPVILVIMGSLVGLIMAAILIPLTDMGRFQF